MRSVFSLRKPMPCPERCCAVPFIEAHRAGRTPCLLSRGGVYLELKVDSEFCFSPLPEVYEPEVNRSRLLPAAVVIKGTRGMHRTRPSSIPQQPPEPKPPPSETAARGKHQPQPAHT